MIDPFPPPAPDALGEALHQLRMSGVFYCGSELRTPWGLDLPPMPGTSMFHVVTAGRLWLAVPGEPGRWLHPGDFALVPHGEGHALGSDARARRAKLFDLPREQVSDRYEMLRHGGDGATTTLVCGAVRFDHPAALHLVRLLPRLLVVEAASWPERDWVASTLRFMAVEARAPRPGGEAVMTRLADVLLISAIRAWLDADDTARQGWLGALRDRRIGRVLARVHREPAREWTLAALAAEAAMSRSAFAARFADLVGEPPMRYVARWRMQVAVGRLRDGDATVGELAGGLGYGSEAAFSRAFKRFVGVSPGAVRTAV